MRTRPVIGVTLDAEEPGGYSKLPWYALRKNYFSALAEMGALPIALPHHPELAESYLEEIDGLLITGGAFDVDPALYGGGPTHPTVTLKSGRTDFELAVTRGALARNKPVLGICGGEQLLAVALGGTLIQHIPDSIAGALEHEQPNPRNEPGHEISIAPGTLLARITGRSRMAVNSAHHQAVAAAGEGAVVNALAPDGVVEGLEHPGYRFALGVQWHPEYAVDPADPLIFKAFVEATRG
ncbi:gamma-glutamyl-gamma-aminobutyrate hydrolase family protein [Siccirubricoccus sp. KC 17139]|uniref:Gamma-glutamyl-gamma-aminobutyrate hydrolase family protein n=1 Tax=Siccirubricoccus soli TaxID=2899147 RepID=A0ABT1DCQ3_9PROT|nr:gamma-glutamyl-gamma-aminobutyrate hydrolase family protein [Siccirubricoccus soli]MCO6419709.1 gamma-glutamyl-gamma-aminobutyrate hydrolase family protein [Siccirubricoccus soli]MCP2685844.1 gamma-glutamyl-gamma-aminobutyrate hydrolase family protein [Siccirubricoccus soli]